MSCCSGTPLHHAPDCKLVHGDAVQAVLDERELNAKMAEEGGCDCSTAECQHDEAGKAIAARIRRQAHSQAAAP